VIVVYNALSVRPAVIDGAAAFSLNIIPELAAALPDDELIALLRPGENRLSRAPNLRVETVVLPRFAGARTLFESFALSRHLRRLKADVFVSPNESVPFWAPCPIVVVAQNLVYHRDDWWRAFQGGRLRERILSHAQAAFYRRRMPAAYARAARVAAVSKTTAQVLAARARLDPEKTRVIYEGSDSVLMPEPRAAARGTRLLVVSTLAPYKGLERTIELYARLRAERPDLELDVVGANWRGFGATLEARAHALGVADSVHFLGSIGAEELAERYETALVLIHLSECESFGLPVVEAMRYGLPVVSSGRSSLAEIAGGAALEPGDDLDRAARAVIALLADERAREKLAAHGRKRAADLTWRSTAEKLAEVVREARGRPRTP
jgi:glycosyltransferase involved in cell wall biosynthesis